MNLYTIRDDKTEGYLPPFCAVNHAVAVRMVMDTTNDELSLFSKHPQDFELFFVGVFEETTGDMIPASGQSLGNLKDIQGQNETK